MVLREHQPIAVDAHKAEVGEGEVGRAFSEEHSNTLETPIATRGDAVRLHHRPCRVSESQPLDRHIGHGPPLRSIDAHQRVVGSWDGEKAIGGWWGAAVRGAAQQIERGGAYIVEELGRIIQLFEHVGDKPVRAGSAPRPLPATPRKVHGAVGRALINRSDVKDPVRPVRRPPRKELCATTAGRVGGAVSKGPRHQTRRDIPRLATTAARRKGWRLAPEGKGRGVEGTCAIDATAIGAKV
mmetsp:Transcript_42727/g.85722  ORF Transcript_42727/g.85722 Transcript_42727/m.85722 type:complete len:240 (-) Transcript_42727:197-916(-)